VPSQQLDGAGLRAGEVLLRAERLCLADTFGGVTVQIAAGDRVAVLGPSGSGTSGLLALLTGELRGDDQEQRLWYAPSMQLVSVDQRTRGLEPGVAVIEQGSARLGHELARHVLATSGLPYPMWSRSPDTLTPRERARVGMAIALARPCDLLVLEEPTADLDLVSVEELERDLSRRLSASNLALILATHDRVLARNLTDRVWSIVDGSLVAHSSVPAYLRGDDAVAPDMFWDETADLEPARHETADSSDDDATTREALEAERVRLHELLTDPLALGERELERARQRVEEIEASLMTVYDASFTPAAPRYRLLEGGLTLYADLVDPSQEHGAGPETRPVPEPETRPESRLAHRLMVVATDDEQAATTAVRLQEPTVPWLDVRVVDGIAHLRIADLPGSCLLPGTVTALVNAGVYLAFTVLGARSTQLFSHEDLSTTSLRDVGGGWWRLTLPQFLTSEGWHGAGRGGFGTSGGRRTRASRRGPRKAETT